MLSLPSSSTMRTAMSSLSQRVIESCQRQQRDVPSIDAELQLPRVLATTHLALLFRELLLHHGDLGDVAQRISLTSLVVSSAEHVRHQ